MDVQKPTTITTSDGIEITKDTTAKGKTLSDGSQDIMTYGMMNDRRIGLQFRDESNERIFMGKDLDDQLVFKFSQPGYDASTTEDNHLIMSSEFNQLKIVSSGTNAQVVSSLAQDATNTSTVVHGLGYIPAAIVYLNGSGSTYLTSGRYYPPTTSIPIKIGATYYPGIIFSFQVDATNIYFTVENRSPLTPITDIGTANWKYYLLAETAN